MYAIYVSSTCEDLAAYRDAVRLVLERLGHSIVSMEQYVAADERPLDRCLADVSGCDVYVGIIAWRYGYIPDHGNPERKSITELEYDRAGRTRRPRLVFLLDPSVPWPARHFDSQTADGGSGELIRRFREQLSGEILVSFFSSPEDLAAKVSVAVQRLARATPSGIRPDEVILKRLVQSLPIASDLSAQLELARASHEATNVQFATGSLLLALLVMRGRFFADRLDETRPGLAAAVEAILERYVRVVLPSASGGYENFDWVERSDVQRAQFHALEDGSPVVREKHLLLGILESGSRSVRDLKSYLGEHDFERLVENTRNAPAFALVFRSPPLFSPADRGSRGKDESGGIDAD
jgi:hypothetical protein